MPNDADVLVVGGGPVGLSLALELGRRDIRTLLVEQNARASYSPRAKTTNVRSMEHMRRWGLAQTIRDASPLPPDYPSDIVFSTRLFGHPITTIRNAFDTARTPRNDLYSEPAQWIPQYKIEAVLRDAVAAQSSVTMRAGIRLDDLTITDDGVTVAVTDVTRDAPETLRVAYAVGADGSRSKARSLIGAKMEGAYAFARNYNLVIRSPKLRDAMKGERSVMYWLVNPTDGGMCGPMDEGDTWYFMFPVPNGAPDPTEADFRARMTAAFGRDVEPEILAVDPWAAHSLIADTYSKADRVFLAGDACHLHPPFGGFGMNLGIADGVDLGWKLAATLQGWGGEHLLASYETERRPVHRRVIDEAVANFSLLAPDLAKGDLEAPGPEGDAARAEVAIAIRAGKTREFYTLGVVLGSHYSGSPLTLPDGTSPPPTDVTNYQPSAHPGCLAPHAWLSDGRSLYDTFGAGFTLLTTNGADPTPFAEAARARDVPLTIAAPHDDRLPSLYGAAYALIRPDQYVAWRGNDATHAAAILDTARGATGTASPPATTA